MSQKKVTKASCIKVDCIRRETRYNNLEEWMNDKNNIYVGRFGRIFITYKDGTKKIYHYSQSKWANPYKVNNPTSEELNTCLINYINYLFTSGKIYDIDELRGKNLGCFCEKQKDTRSGRPLCHAQVLADILNKCYHLLEKEIRRRKRI